MKFKIYFTSGNTLECEDPFLVTNEQAVGLVKFEVEDVVIFVKNVEAVVKLDD